MDDEVCEDFVISDTFREDMLWVRDLRVVEDCEQNADKEEESELKKDKKSAGEDRDCGLILATVLR